MILLCTFQKCSLTLFCIVGSLDTLSREMFGVDRATFDTWQQKLVHVENVLMINLPRVATLEGMLQDTNKRLSALDVRVDREFQRRRLAAP